MSDESIWATYRALRDLDKVERADRRALAPQILLDNGVSFKEHNDGAHLIVTDHGMTVDFWPGTEKWITRPTKTEQSRRGRGIDELLTYLEQRRKV